MGVSNAGFRHEAVIEWNRNACETIRVNQRLKVQPIIDWPLHEMDASDFEFSSIKKEIDLVSAGPPCQPFSIGGKHLGVKDGRNMFPLVIHAVRQLKPKAIIIENVKGLLRPLFAKYFEYVYLQLSYPEISQKAGESWSDHLARLEKFHTQRKKSGLTYNVLFRLLNAADYGVPQRRERVFLVGFRSDINDGWSFPKPTHSQLTLLWSQYITGEYWKSLRIPNPAKRIPPQLKTKIHHMQSKISFPEEQPWVTVREAIGDLPSPMARKTKIPNHRFMPGAKVYKGHTGSALDEPAKTLKAGDHGVPGGENMVVLNDKHVRYFTVRESARLQTFPDEFVFHGSWTECMRQIGNAVPVKLAQVVADSVRTHLIKTSFPGKIQS